MKSFITACVALALTVAAGIASSVVICRTADGLSKMAEALPPAGETLADGADALKRIDGIGSFWEGKRRAPPFCPGTRASTAPPGRRFSPPPATCVSWQDSGYDNEGTF